MERFLPLGTTSQGPLGSRPRASSHINKLFNWPTPTLLYSALPSLQQGPQSHAPSFLGMKQKSTQSMCGWICGVLISFCHQLLAMQCAGLPLAAHRRLGSQSLLSLNQGPVCCYEYNVIKDQRMFLLPQPGPAGTDCPHVASHR